MKIGHSRKLFWILLLVLIVGCYTTVKPPQETSPSVPVEEQSAKPSETPPITSAPEQKPKTPAPAKIQLPQVAPVNREELTQERLTPQEKQAMAMAEFQVDFAQKTATLKPITRTRAKTGPSVQSSRAPAVTDFIKINTGNFQFDFQNGIFSFDVTLVNTSPNLIVSSPLRAVIDRLRPAPPAISISNADGGGRGNGAFFEYSGFAGGDQQLAPGETSAPRHWQFFNPQMRLFSFIVRVDGQLGGNSPPVLNAIGNQTVDLGRTLTFKLTATDPNPKDSLAFTSSPLPLPANASLNAMTGVFTFRPRADQVGAIMLTFMVSDGKLQDSEAVTITVRKPPGGVTAISGLTLDTNDFVRGVETPVIGAVVSLLGSSRTATSDQNGNFLLSDIPAGHQVFDLDVTNARPAPDGSPYSGFREEVDLIEGVTNFIERPFFLPRLARESLTQVNPNVTTVVNNPTLQTTMTVPPNTAKMGSANFTGMLSISEVPKGLAPAALPEALRPGMLITIQPVGVTFQTPVPIIFPNTDNLAPGTETDIWSLDAGTGVFVVVGTGRVSADGKSINTISGGIRAADWHMTLPPSGSPDDRGNNNDNHDQDKCTDCDTGSQTAVNAGNLAVDHTLASYRSLGQSRAPRLVYNSTHADPRPIISTLNTISRRAAVPLTISTQLQVAGVNQGMELFTTAAGLNENVDEVVRQAVQFEASQFATGLYPYRFALTSNYARSSVSGASVGTVLVTNEQKSPFGAGWTLDGLSQLHFAPDGNVLLTEGDGSTRLYSIERTIFVSDFSGGTITRVNLNTLETKVLVTGLTSPEDGACGPDGRIYFAESSSARITRFNQDGSERTPMNTGGQNAEGLVFDANGNLYFNTRGNNHTGVWRIDTLPSRNHPDSSKAPVRVIPPFTSFGEGTAIANDGDILAVARAEGNVVRFDMATQTLNPNFITGLSNTVYGIDIDKEGNIYVADAGSNSIKKFTDGGAPQGEVATNLQGPGFLEIDNAGNLYIAEDAANRITKIDPRGRQTQIPLPVSPVGMALCEPPPGNQRFQYKSPSGDFSTFTRNDGGTYTRRLKDGTQINFNAQGLQTSVVDRNGNTTKYEYDANDRLIKITDPVNLATTLAYTNGLLTQITGPANRTTRFTHDAGGNLIRIQDPDNTSAQFGYDAQHRLTTQISKRGFSTTYAYDFAGRNVKVTRPDASTNEIAYSEATGLIDPASGLGTKSNPAPVVRPEAVAASFKDGNGYLTRFKTDRFGASTETVDPLGRRAIITRDENGNPTRVVNPNGAVTRLSYDSRGNLLTSIINPSGFSRLSCGQLLAGDITDVGEQDSLTFEANRNDAVYITLSELQERDAGFDVRADLISPAGAVILRAFNSRRFFNNLPAAGTYVIRIYDNANLRRGSYALRFDCIAPATPNSQLLACGQTVADTIRGAVDSDLFIFNAQAGNIVSLTLAETGDIDQGFVASYDFYSPTGVAVATNALGRRQFTLAETGPYVIKIFDNSNLRRGAYALGLECIAPPSPNAKTLICGQAVRDTIAAVVEADLFTFTAQQGNVVSVALATTQAFDTGFDARFDLFSPTGQQLATATTSRQQFTLAATGTYVIKVFDNANIRRGAYVLGLECLVPPGAGVKNLACGQVAADTINAAVDADLYQFTAAAGNVVSLTLALTKSFDTGFDARYDLFSPTGQQLATSATSRQQYTLNVAGTYVLRVFDINNIRRGTYSLGMECLVPPSADALPLACGQTLADSIYAAADADLFTFTSEANKSFTITLTETRDIDAGFVARADLFSPTGAVVASSFIGARTVNLAAAGTYVIRVYDNANFRRGTYTLGLQCLNLIKEIALLKIETEERQEPSPTPDGIRPLPPEAIFVPVVIETTPSVADTAAFPIKTTFTYEPIFNQVTSIVDPNGDTTKISYDAKGNPIQLVDALNNQTALAYNSQGLLTRTTDALENNTAFEYDAKSNLIKTTDALGNATALTYDTAGNVNTSRDAEGRATQFAYDAMNRLIRVTDAIGGVTNYEYDPEGNLLEVKDAKGNLTSFEYDARNRLSATIDPRGQDESFTYDGNGNLLSTLDRNLQTIVFQYDPVNQLIKKILPGTQVTTFAYDDVGNLTRVDDPDSKLALTYDAANRLSSVSTKGSSNQPEVTLAYTYDASGNRRRMIDSQTGATNYTYDALNRLTAITNPALQTVSFEYDSLSRRTKTIFPNGVTTTYAYDALSQLTSLAHALGASTISSFGYAYDKVGNRTTLNTTRTGVNITPRLNYTYDALNRLIQATHPLPTQPNETFNYDAVGNRLRRDGQTADAAFDSTNRLLQDVQFTYRYDNNGNLIQKTEKATGKITRYTFDAENQLIQIQEFPNASSPASKTVTYRYDGLGRRIEKNVDGIIIRYGYDKEDILLEFDGSNKMTAKYTHGIRTDEPLLLERSGQVFFYHADGLGSIAELTNSTGTIVQAYIFDSFGQIVQKASTILNTYTYTGREFDVDGFPYYYRARYFEFQTGRFLQEDPIRFEGGVNFYEYAGNNPVSLTDPFGLYGTNSCEYYKRRCAESGGTYYCETAPDWCNKFPKDPAPDLPIYDDFVEWSKCTRQCLQDCDAQSFKPPDPGSCNKKPDPQTDEFTDWQHTKCHIICYLACALYSNQKF